MTRRPPPEVRGATAPAPAVLVGAGDIASCASGGDEATARLLDGIGGTVFTAGDNAYGSGSAAQYARCYAPSWGRHTQRTRPAPGNHDYHTAGASGYFGYFGARAGRRGEGWYSYDLKSWHVVVLNSNVSMSAASPQVAWLRADLAAHRTQCTLAYWHHPLFSSGNHGDDARSRPVWQVLYRMGVDSRYAFRTVRRNSQARYDARYGVLQLSLYPSSYRWSFIATDGGSKDSGTGRCHQ